MNENSSNGSNDSPKSLVSESTYNDHSSASWFLDSGATNHMTNDANQMRDKVDYKGKAQVMVGNGKTLPITHIGINSVSTLQPNRSLILKDVLHVPNLTKNLVSISQFTRDDNVILLFDSTSCLVKDKSSSHVLLHGTLNNGLYTLNVQPSNSTSASTKSQVPQESINTSTPTALITTTTSNVVYNNTNIASV